MVWADSRRITRALRYLGVLTHTALSLWLTRLSLSLAALSRAIQLNWALICWKLHFSNINIPLPLKYNTRRLSRILGLGSSPFAHHYWGNHTCFLFLALLRCFSSRRSPSYLMCSDKSTLGLPEWVSPFGHLRIKAWLTTPRSLWQPSASFIASWCQGIHQKPFSINHKFW